MLVEELTPLLGEPVELPEVALLALVIAEGDSVMIPASINFRICLSLWRR